jgi:hypothetical protein
MAKTTEELQDAYIQALDQLRAAIIAMAPKLSEAERRSLDRAIDDHFELIDAIVIDLVATGAD